MEKIINGNKINYIDYGQGKAIVLLHGWGQNIEMMKFLADRLEGRKIIIDFPGFGKSPEPSISFDVKDYTNMLHEFLLSIGVNKPVLIGHSFGGRISIKYGSIYDVERIILFGSPCIRVEKKPDFKQKIYKYTKHTLLGPIIRELIASPDYKAASKIMRETLVKVVNEDLLDDAKKISVPTLLIWGDHDEAVPIDLARKQVESMKDAALIELQGSHYAYLENLDTVSCIVNSFNYPKIKQLKK